MNKLIRSILLSALLPLGGLADDAPPPPPAELVQRADKIVAQLGLSDPVQAERIRLLIARQYEALRPIHQLRDTALQLAKESSDKAEAEKRQRLARTDATARLAEINYAFVARLTAELSPAQVEGVKNGMTYGVAPNTFAVYQKMLPDLTPEQRLQIHAWLLEAREHAMTASTSDEKHGWFGKYKGKINNYLSRAGYDMKAAEKNLKK